MRVVFFGTAEFAVPILRRLSAHPSLLPALVITQPDRPRGRGRRLDEPPVKSAARDLGLPVLQPERLRSRRLQDVLLAQKPDLFVVAAYGRILPRSLLGIPRLAPVNVHGSLLPAYRGAAPVQRALLDGVRTTGVTTIWMNERMDEGDILMQAPVAVAQSDTTGSLTARLADAGAALLIQTVLGLAEGSIAGRPQADGDATYAAPIGPDDAVIRWTDSAQVCHDRIRAMAPRPGAVTTMSSRRLKVLQAMPRDAAPREEQPGVVTGASADQVHVATGAGELSLIRVQPESGKEMSAGAWARGARVLAGSQFDVRSPDHDGSQVR